MPIPYKDLMELQNNGVLIDRVSAALLKAVYDIITSGSQSTPQEEIWIREVFSNTTTIAKNALKFLLIDNIDLSIYTDINDLTDAEIQASIDKIIVILID